MDPSKRTQSNIGLKNGAAGSGFSLIPETIDQLYPPTTSAQAAKGTADINMPSQNDLESIWAWNREVPQAIGKSIPEMVEERVKLQPDALAVSAWDGELTYADLDRLASLLAGKLANLQLDAGAAEILIPLFFEKSKWTSVAMLGVLKAGAAFVLLDPSIPHGRLESIVQQVKANFILSSASNAPAGRRLVRDVLIIDSHFFKTLGGQLTHCRLPHPNPSSVMYAIFTSGSTGTPKGVILTHQNHASALHHQTRSMGITSKTRIYDFSSYSFDLTIFNTFSALTLGGCLCVPSEHDRRDRLAESIRDSRATWVYLTPTVARQLSPDQLPDLEMLVFIGEALHTRDLTTWRGSTVRCMNTYGPSECTTASTINSTASTLEEAIRIGKGAGMNTWIVDPDNHESLMPLGSVGELLLEGPLVGNSYIGESEKTAAAFISDPTWLLRGFPDTLGRKGRLYKTGDLVRYNNDGSLSFVGRKDNQVKIRGNRVELGEIECVVLDCMPEATQVIVELITSQDSSSMLVAFLKTRLDAESESDGPGIFPVPADIKSKIAGRLPSYMVPTVFFTVRELPLTPSGKTDRRRLREIGAAFSSQQLAQLQAPGQKRQPATKAEKELHKLWAQVLHLEADNIGLDDEFFQLGGDSVNAMKLVAEARKAGLRLTVANIFRQPRLQDVASQSEWLTETLMESEKVIAPFALLGEAVDVPSLLRDISSQSQVDSSSIKDAYPCTPLQEGLFSLSSKAGDYIMQGVLELSSEVDLAAFQAAWQEVVRSVAILRTRIVYIPNHDRLLQIVLDEPLRWITASEGLSKYLEEDKKSAMELGQPLTRFALIKDAADAVNAKWFAWTMHHSLYDEWSLSLLLDMVNQVYAGNLKAVELVPPFQTFIQYLQSQDDEETRSYWSHALDECEAASFPALPPSIERPLTDCVIEDWLQVATTSSSIITAATLVRAAWGLIMERMTNSDDVVFGATVSGRSAPVADIHAIPFPTIATIPVRIRIPASEQKVSEYLASVQRQFVDVIPFEQYGLHRIAKVSSSAEHACGFQTLLVIQPNDNDDAQGPLGNWRLGNEQQSFNTYALIIEIHLRPESVSARASFDSRVIKPWVVKGLLERLEFTVNQLGNTDKPLRDIQAITSRELKQIWEWNSVVPPAVELSIPQVISERALAQPNAPAICAWDGEITYSELERLASALARRLVDLKVGPGMLVPLHFEKSMWTTVAILAVLKARGGFVLLDPSLPEQRLKEIIRQVGAKLTVSSFSTQNISERLTDQIVVVDHHLFDELETSKTQSLNIREIDPLSVAYVIFTSGSMGIPKGVIVTHRNVVSAVPEHISRLAYTTDSRIYDFASYSFGAAINNVMAALISGACLCVPSDNDRRSNLAGSLMSLRATVVLLTPSVAESLSPQKVPTLRSIIFGGEAVRMKDVMPWWGHVKVITAYGSSEVTTISIINNDAVCPDEVPRIGKGAGGVTWVVDPDNHEVLLPPGCIGELLLEGPLVGLGYLDDVATTTAAFVENPKWLSLGANGIPGRSSRIYKSGDLVCYNEDGSLSYIGRKDAQVKIRGQRVELGEVEAQVQQHLSDAKQIVAEVINPQAERPTPTLVVFIQNKDGAQAADEDVKLLKIPSDIENKLAEYLPSYMVPAIFFVIKELPMTPTGKMNRRRLREIGATFSMKQLIEVQTTGRGTKRQPQTEIEQKIQRIWSQILNTDSALIGLDDSFFQLGGDSITAMQVASLARTISIHIRVADILREKTIFNIARIVDSLDTIPTNGTSTKAVRKIDVHPSQLSPMQRLYFHLQTHPTACFDQFFHLKLRRSIDRESLFNALEKIVQRHSILRARFKQNEMGNWEQHITDDVTHSFHLHVQDASDSQSSFDAISHCRGRLDIQNGPILSALFSNESADNQTLFVDIHHLIVDLVSWRVILQELEEILTTGAIVMPAPPIDFLSWSAMQAQYASEKLKVDAPLKSGDQEHLSYWGLSNKTNNRGGIITREFTIDESISSIILGSGNDVLKTRPLELMMSALFYSLTRVFDGRRLPTIFSEGHGRESWDDDVDVSATVGWFSTIFPVNISAGAKTTFKDIIRQTKDSIRSLRRNGWSHFTSRFADEASVAVFANGYPVEILFNYAGLYQQLERSDGLFEQIHEIPGECSPSSSFDVQRFALFDIDVQVERGQIVTSIEFHKDMHHQEKILSWIKEFESSFGVIAQEVSAMSADWTLSDFPLAFQSYDAIDEFRQKTLAPLDIKPEDVEDIFPCAPLQEGILVSQAKDAANYQRWVDFEVRVDKDGAHLDKGKLKQAWRAVVKRHPLLRAVLFDAFPGTSKMMHVILRDPVVVISSANTVQDIAKGGIQKNGLQHHLTIYDVGKRKARLRFEINHAITDGVSQSILCQDFQSAYNGLTLSTAGSYKDFISYLKGESQDEGLGFWKETLAEVEPCHIPPSSLSDSDTSPFTLVDVPDIDTNKIRRFCATWDVTPATVIQTAWALVLNTFTGAAVPCFGNLFSGRDVSIRCIDDTFGPFIGLVPFCVRLDDKSRSVLETLRQAQKDYLRILPYQHFPLAEIHRALGLGSRPLFNSLLSFQRVDKYENADKNGLIIKEIGSFDPTEYDVTIDVMDSSAKMEIRLNFRPGSFTYEEATRLVSCVSIAISEIIEKPNQVIKQLSFISKVDLDQILKWNSIVPETIDECIHDLIENRVKSQPGTSAVYSWDGELSYIELDRLANGLAGQLITLGVKEDIIVPLCFEKSLWTPVAMLATLKAGGAFVLLDTSLPEQRLQAIVKQTEAKIILSSVKNLDLSSRLCKSVVKVCADSITSTESLEGRKSQSSSTAMFAIFTSGSTGTPKGVVITHANFSTCLKYQTEALGFNKESRVFDFSSYAFDIAVHNAIASFVTGACLCIPSDDDRKNNLAGSMRAMKVSVADLTPSVARLIDPSAVPDLKTLILAGEAVTVSDASRWWGKAHVVNAYGPAECHISTINANSVRPEEVVHVGKGAGLLTWVVDPENHDTLVPVGCIGELLLDGPLVGRGYIGEPQKTAAVFLENPSLLLTLSRSGRVYKTGDLVRYDQDGNLIFLGRKDSQVKIHGQRVELGEVEHRVQECFPESIQVVAEVVAIDGNKTLAAFVQTGTDSRSSVKIMTIDLQIKDSLSKHLPQHMVPNIFFSLSQFPMTTTGKVNRRTLRDMGASFSAQEVAEIQTASQSVKHQPETEIEQLMQIIWARVLNIGSEAIGLDDAFFQLGGDSIGAMKVVAEARNLGLQLAVMDIFHYTTLRDISRHSMHVQDAQNQDIAPFSLLDGNVDTASLIQSVKSQYQIDAAIQDIYPCTPIQEGLFSLSLKRSGDYVLQSTLELSSDISLPKFRSAWEEVARTMPILRTRIIQDNDSLKQVILDEEIRWIETSGLEAYLEVDRKQSMDIGKPLARYALVHDDAGHVRWFVWTVHHVLYDGWSEPLIIKAVHKAYQGQKLDTGPQFQAFIKYIKDQHGENMLEYWKNALEGNEATQFPRLTSSADQSFADKSIGHPLSRPASQTRNVTTSSLIRAALALVIGKMTNTEDVVFGVTVSGRSAPVVGVEKLVAPTIATIPVRIRLSSDQKIEEFLQTVQQQSTQMIPYEQMGLHEIAHTSADCQQACDFQTLLVIQPQESNDKDILGKWHDGDQQRWFNTFGLVLVVQITVAGISVKASFDSNMIEESNVLRLLQRLDHVMLQLDSALPDKVLHDITMVTPEDLAQVWQWNQTLPEAADRFVHEMIADFAQTQPDAPAICAWDGDFTYKELDDLSNKLSAHLFAIGAGPGKFVAILFEKSKWTTVAMLAVMKSTASFVLLDPSLPMQHLESIVNEVEARLIISSPLNASMGTRLCPTVTTLDDFVFTQIAANKKLEIPPRGDIDAVNYVVFTSGTTGKPKGAVISHRSSASAVKYQGKGFGYTKESRVYDFSNYSFDGSHLNAYTVLTAGGCLCVPTDHDRKNRLGESMESLKANAVFLTPTVAELLTPTQIPHLKSMILGGEAIRVRDIKPWWDADGVRVFTIYGTSECTPVSMVNPFPATPEDALGIGMPYGVCTWVVDPDDYNSLMPVGCVGELFVEGPLVGNGYLNDPVKTAAAFIADPAWLVQGGRQGRLYRTGDLVHYKQDGSLVFKGRKDSQVKIRGQRVELSDVEHQVQECMPDATQVIAELIMPQGEKKTSPILAAFLQIGNALVKRVSEADLAAASGARIIPIPGDVEEKLAQRLPSYMVPTIFFTMEKLPVGTTGKMDRKQLRQIGSTFSAQQVAKARSIDETGPKRQPETKIEVELQKIWAQILDIEPASVIGLDDSFFKLGGNSIAAMKVVGEARKLDLQVAVADIFRYPRLHQLAGHVFYSENCGLGQVIKRSKSGGPVEQSFAQGRLWFLEQLYPGLTWYLMPCVMKLEGPLDLNALNVALLALERRHETLRTVFSTVNGVNMQHVSPVRTEKKLSIIQISPDDEDGLAEALREDETTPFNLERDPGWRTILYKLGEDTHVLSLVMHHIISDGWSVDILRKELASFYSAALRGIKDPLSQIDPLPIQYRDFSAWEKTQDHVHERQLEYWAAQLETSQPAEFFCDKPRPEALSGHADVQTLNITGDLYDSLQLFCQEHNVTPFIALLGAFRATHYRLTGQDDATIGSPNANREQWEIKDSIGFFVNMQCLRIKLEDDTLSFEQLVQQVKTATISSLANQNVPFERIVSRLQHGRDLSRHPLVQVVFAVHSQLDLGQFTLENVKTQYIDQSITSRFDLECHFFQERDSLRGEILFSTDLYLPETITNLISVFNELLKQTLKNPKASLASLPLMTDIGLAELHARGLMEMERTNYPRDLSVVEVFQRQVAACPDRVAVRDRVSELTYAELDQKSSNLAHWLGRHSFAPEKLIGVVSSHSCLVIIAYLGIMKANLAYLPFDPKVPMSRMDGILSSIEESSLVLVGPGFQPPPLRESVKFVRIEDVLEEGAKEARESNQQPAGLPLPTPTSLAYVMFTSGSTGRPKGVMIEHRGIVRLVKDTNVMQHPVDAVMGHMSNIGFDASTWEIYACLLNGGTLICIDTVTVLDQGAMPTIFTTEQISVIWITPALLTQYLAECPTVISKVKTMYIGGERVDIQGLDMARALMGPNAKIICIYGPTENTSFSTFYPFPLDDKCANGVAIGRSISNSGTYVMDLKQQLVPLGVVGELVVTGDGLARGYTLPQLNVNRFVNISTGAKTSVRGYRTGDYVRIRPLDGMLEFLGRIDGQIKLRGQRVELGEIESVLRSHKSVDTAAAVLQKEEGRDAQLVAFVTLRKQDVEDVTELVEGPAEDDVAKQVDSWEEMFDEETYADLENVQPDLVGRDFIGWTSMYDGSDIDKGEMSEWLDDTIKSIINGSSSLNVLEIGSGSGMIAFNLTGVINSYVGLDPSQKAVSLISRSAETIPGLSSKVRMYKGTATDIAQLGPITPNLVVVNSVAQYFPSQEYLLKLISDALQLGSVTTLFFGDMRSYTLYKEFQVTKALFRSSDGVSKDDVRYLMSETEQSQMELLVDPGFFTSLPNHFPDMIHHVEIIPKCMLATNELSCYRFAAIIHVRRDGRKEEIHQISQEEWIDFAGQNLNRTSLTELLRESRATVALKNIPYSKTILERFVIDALKTRASDESDWLADAYEKAAKCASLAATDLEGLAEQAGYSVEISWACQFTQRGGLDAVFHKYKSDGYTRVLFNFPTDHEGRSFQTLCNQPLQQRLKQRIREQLQESLEAQLPSYMVPKIIAFIEKMPVNDNGKMDRRALTDNVQRRTAGRPSLQQPTTEIEKQMQKIWAKVLHLNPATIGVHDSFFTIGGDSLAAMKIVGEARKAGFKLAVADIFRGSTLKEVADRATVADGASSGSILKTQVEGPVEQSFAQRRLWFLEQLYPGLTWYLMPCAIRIRGSLHLDALRGALSAIETRHDTLRTTFESVNGVEMQVVQPFQPKDLKVMDVLDEEALKNALHKDHTTPIDLLVEPGWRVALYRIGGDEKSHVLSIVMHHIISDGWSVEVLQKELAKFYKAGVQNQDPLSTVEPLPIQYRDFSVWQRSEKQVEEHDRQLNYWIKQLETSQPAEFFCDKPRPPTLSGRADVKSLRIQGEVYEKLQKFCKSRGLTLFVVLLAAFRATHFRLTGVTDGNIGTVNANRDRWEVKDMIGFFVNMQNIRIQVEDESFEELVRHVHRVTADSFANQDVPFENIVSKLQKDRDLSRHPLSQTIFAIHSQMDLGSFKLDSLDTEQIAVPPTTRFDMEFHVFQEQDALQGEVLFSTDLYAPETIANMLSVFSKILERSLNDPSSPIVSLSLLAKDDYFPPQKLDLVDIARTEYPRDSSIVDLFREQAALHPEKIAVRDFSPSELTYRELDEKSDAIANWLYKYRLAPEALVGVFCSRSCESAFAFIGVLKAHLAYLPFHLKLPQSKMEAILSSIPGRKIVLVGSEVEPPAISLEGVEFVRISDALDEQARQQNAALDLHPLPLASSLAYVIFTSGSTGRPKGVMVEHRGIVRLVRESNMVKHLPPNVIMAHLTNLAFDVSAWEMYSVLLNGGTLICIDEMMLLDPRAMSEIFIQENVQSAIFTPAILKSLLEQAPAALAPLEALYVAGDKADADDLSISRGLMKGNAVINAYGPTENSVISTLFVLPEEERCLNGVPIGQAISNSGACVMDRQQRLVPTGVVGELVVTGDGLARGYLDPEQDVNRFVIVSLNGEETKAYRTGDYVRRRPIDGEIEFFGRIDGQIKIRGHRVELGEIELVLHAHKAVNDAVAVLQHEEGHEPQIVGFVTVGETKNTRGEDTNTEEHVKVWEELFDAETYQSVDQVDTEKIGRDFIGWKSMYDGNSIDNGEMNEWLDETIKAITLSGGEPRRVLEIGTGTGMILFNLLNHGLLHYTGFEPSEQAVRFILKTAKSVPTLADKISMHKGTAADVGKLPSTSAPNLVIVNSVAQYFPSQEYLVKVVEDILKLGSVETIFFGDIRSHALYREFRASKILFAVADDAAVSKDDVLQRMAELERTELELLVDPAFFTALASKLPQIEHVEILPKRMHATNELSSYRYDVVLHVKLDVPRQVHAINDDQWIDYAKQKLDKISLLERLQGSGSEVVAISNIPYSKTIFERFALESLDKGAGNRQRRHWIPQARQRAQECSSMDAADLVALAEASGFRVEISWARQYSQRGGLDAIFHRFEPGGKEGSRVLFRFPIEHHGRPSHLLTSRPLRQQRNQMIQDNLYQKLQTQLPPYMVPQAIIVLDKLPVNDNGKVDRKALAARRQTRAPLAHGALRKPSTNIELQMQTIWSQILNIDASEIGLDSSFFHLGGNSITAMKVVSEARKLGLQLVVADMFNYDTIEELSRQCTKPVQNGVELDKVVLVEDAIKATLLEEIDALGLDMRSIDVTDILPLTSFQEKSVVDGIQARQHGNYFYLDLGAKIDIEKFQASCALVLDKFPILHARFLKLGGVFWQVIFRNQPDLAPVRIQDVGIENLDKASDSFCVKDMHELTSTGFPLGFTILHHESQGSRLILRLSHAQYDGISFPIILQSLMDSYNNVELSPGPDYSKFLAYSSLQRKSSMQYWKKLLRGSSLTALEPAVRPKMAVGRGSKPQRVFERAEMDLPRRLPGKTTCATVISAAWAILLSLLTGQEDVVYGNVVTGRNSAMQGIGEVVGACLNIIPVRVSPSLFKTPSQLLLFIQEQSFSVGEADTLGYNDIIKHCTDWPAGSDFDAVIQHQNVDEHPEIQGSADGVNSSNQGGSKGLLSTKVQFYGNPDYVPMSFFMASYPKEKEERVEVQIFANTHIMSGKVAAAMARDLGRIVGSLGKIDKPMGKVLGGFELEVKKELGL